jgi:hypothetical protein
VTVKQKKGSGYCRHCRSNGLDFGSAFEVDSLGVAVPVDDSEWCE